MTSEMEILNLLYEYCWLVDQGRYEEIGELFAEADIYFGETLAYSHDKAAFAGMFAGSNISYAPDNTPRTIHMCIDPVIVVDEAAGTAKAKHYTAVVQGIPDEESGLCPSSSCALRIRASCARPGIRTLMS